MPDDPTAQAPIPGDPPETFSVWASSDSHTVREALGEGCDPQRVPRESMAEAIGQVEGPGGFEYDIGFHLGDLLDYDHETAENFRKYREQLARSGKDPHHWYHLGGNNDENSVLNDDVEIDNEHYRRVIDPVGEFTETSGIRNDRRPYPVQGTYERYHFDVGNVRFLFLSDRNDLPNPYGRGEGGFFVDGAITLEAFEWLTRQVLAYPDRILVVACHHPLRDTTIGTGIDDSWQAQFMTPYNQKRQDDPTKRLQGTLHQVYPVDEFDTPLFRRLLGQNAGGVDLWMSGHVHHLVDQTHDGRGKYAHALGTHHLNVGTLCRYRHFVNIISAQSTLFSWRAGERDVRSRVYVHDHPSLPPGFHEPETRSLTLKRPFAWQVPAVSVAPPAQHAVRFQVQKVATDRWRLYWSHDATGTLIVRSSSADFAFRPVDGEAYYPGKRVPHGEVIFSGTGRQSGVLADLAGTSASLYAWTYNAGGGDIRYGPAEPVVLRPGRE